MVIIGTPAPFDQPEALQSVHWLAVLPYRLRRVPPLRRAWFSVLASLAKDPAAHVDGMVRFFGAEDRAVFADPIFRPRLEQVDDEVWAQGPTGVDSDHAVTSNLGFNMADVLQHVDIYHGQTDTFIRPDAAPQLATLLPDTEVHPIPGGHLNVFTQWTTLLGALASRARQTAT